MNKTYEIKHEPATINGQIINKYNIYYYDEDGVEETKEFHSTDGINGKIRNGYILKETL